MKRRPDLITPAAKLRHAVESLHLAWDDARVHWRDDVARRFHHDHLHELAPQVDATLAAVERLSALMADVTRDVGPEE